MLLKREKKVLFCLFCLCLSVHSKSVSQEKFEKKRLNQIDSTLIEFKEKDKYKYLNLLPQVSYDALNNSFNVGFSMVGLSSYYQQKKRNKIVLAQLEENLKDKLKRELERIDLEIESFKIDVSILTDAIEVFKIDFDLFQITKGKYNNNELSTEQFLKLKKNYVTKKNSLKNSLLKLELRQIKINQKLKNDFGKKSLFNLSNSINNYD